MYVSPLPDKGIQNRISNDWIPQSTVTPQTSGLLAVSDPFPVTPSFCDNRVPHLKLCAASPKGPSTYTHILSRVINLDQWSSGLTIWD